jgi:chemotaxis protein histidine kinase CheA
MATQNSLKDKVRITGSGDEIDMDAIARAEKALEKLSVEFDGWLSEEVTRLLAARAALDSSQTDEAFDEFYRAAHDLKGEGDTFGYPLVTELADLLCKLLEAAEDRSELPMTLIDNHVDAIHIVMRDGIKDAQHDTTRAVIERLSEVVGDYEAYFARQQVN